MDDVPLLQELQCLQNLSSVCLDHWNFEALVLLVLNVLEQVFVEKFKDKYLVVPPPQVFEHPYNVVLVIRVFLHKLFKNFSLRLCELMVNFCVSIDLQSHTLLFLVIVSTNHLGETAFTQNTFNFKSVQNVVSGFHHQVPLFVINRACALSKRTEVNFVV